MSGENPEKNIDRYGLGPKALSIRASSDKVTGNTVPTEDTAGEGPATAAVKGGLLLAMAAAVLRAGDILQHSEEARDVKSQVVEMFLDKASGANRLSLTQTELVIAGRCFSWPAGQKLADYNRIAQVFNDDWEYPGDAGVMKCMLLDHIRWERPDMLKPYGL